MSANVEAMVREGVNAFKSGRKDEARALLLKATELDPYNEQAWLWLSGLMDESPISGPVSKTCWRSTRTTSAPSRVLPT